MTDVSEIIEHADALPDGIQKVRLYEKAIQIADNKKDDELAWRLRLDFIPVCSDGGCPDRMLVAFSWCLAYYDKSPEDFEVTEILWYYKWVLNALCNFPNISKEKIFELLNDFEERSKSENFSPRTVHYIKSKIYRGLKDFKLMSEELKQCFSMPRDDMSDCEACEQHYAFYNAYNEDNYDEALKLADPIMSGELSCRSVPHTTLPYILLINQSKSIDSRQLFHKAFRMIKGKPIFLANYLDISLYLLKDNDLTKAWEIIDQSLIKATESTDPSVKFYYYTAAVLVYSCIDKSKRLFKYKLPSIKAFGEHEKSYKAIAKILKSERDQLAKAFDKRNGNSYYRNKTKTLDDFVKSYQD